jgi:glucose/arabinose dehydrogenase
MRRLSTFLLLAGLALACSDSTGPDRGGGGTPATALTLVPVDSGYDFSVFVTAPPGDSTRLLVVERGGRILLRKNGVRQDSAFLNLTSLTDPGEGEYGIYSLAFHPLYATNRKLYVYYADVDGHSQVDEFTAGTGFDHASLASRKPILTQQQDPATVLYGGLMTFGPDGKLYLGLGDGHVYGPKPIATTAQDSTSLLGKILRIDVDAGDPYAIPADNPFVGRAGWRGEIWQLGLRNPWRWSFDRETGDVWIGDVGEDLIEEISFTPAAQAAGANFGWPTVEGIACFQPAVGCVTTGYVMPLLVYPHGPACATTGGYVYRGNRFPELKGSYFFGDYCGGWVRAVRRQGASTVEAYIPLATPLINDNPVSFGEDATGEIYVVMASGRIYRIALATAPASPGEGAPLFTE